MIFGKILTPVNSYSVMILKNIVILSYLPWLAYISTGNLIVSSAKKKKNYQFISAICFVGSTIFLKFSTIIDFIFD